jgi:hypothetical protein
LKSPARTGGRADPGSSSRPDEFFDEEHLGLTHGRAVECCGEVYAIDVEPRSPHVEPDFRLGVLALQPRLPLVLDGPPGQHGVPREVAVRPFYAAKRHGPRTRQRRRQPTGNVPSVLQAALLETDDIATLGGDQAASSFQRCSAGGLNSVLTVINRKTGVPEKPTLGAL